ncbi:MAG TPA: hypothetical protein VNA15_07865 [Candidatus Angelobacter sp.]|nr:hypothetical protein [Candidatus Angelobacter sp.]
MQLVRGELNVLTDRSEHPGLITAEKRELDELRREVEQLKTPEGLIEILAKAMSIADRKAFAEALNARLELLDKSDEKGFQSGN